MRRLKEQYVPVISLQREEDNDPNDFVPSFAKRFRGGGFQWLSSLIFPRQRRSRILSRTGVGGSAKIPHCFSEEKLGKARGLE